MQDTTRTDYPVLPPTIDLGRLTSLRLCYHYFLNRSETSTPAGGHCWERMVLLRVRQLMAPTTPEPGRCLGGSLLTAAPVAAYPGAMMAAQKSTDLRWQHWLESERGRSRSCSSCKQPADLSAVLV